MKLKFEAASRSFSRFNPSEIVVGCGATINRESVQNALQPDCFLSTFNPREFGTKWKTFCIFHFKAERFLQLIIRSQFDTNTGKRINKK
jgi:hypothetical protein